MAINAFLSTASKLKLHLKEMNAVSHCDWDSGLSFDLFPVLMLPSNFNDTKHIAIFKVF